MPNRILSDDELAKARVLLAMVRTGLQQFAGNDSELLFALRRKVYKELTYDERSKPMARRKLKTAKRKEQGGVCACCSNPLPETDCVLDRFTASGGYTSSNTRLLCPHCDKEIQKSRGYK